MLDKRTAKMMECILRICKDGSYKLIEIKDLEKSMLPRFKIDAESVLQIIKFLTDSEMIDVKYSDENVYCIAVLPKGRLFEETKHDKTGPTVTKVIRGGIGNKTIVLIAGITFVSAFLGALLGCLIVKLF